MSAPITSGRADGAALYHHGSLAYAAERAIEHATLRAVFYGPAPAGQEWVVREGNTTLAVFWR